MKVIFLNIWSGKVYEPLMEYLRDESRDTDFFCLQEVFDSPHAHTVSWGGRADIFTHLKNALPGFTPYYTVAVENYDGDAPTNFPLTHGIAIFARQNIAIASHGDFLISGEDWHGPGTSEIFPHKLQYVRFKKDGALHTLANLHGTAILGNKLDTPARIAQSQKIVDFLNSERGRKIIGGDFNLMPDTESIRMIEHTNMRNLIKEYAVTDTRGAIAHERYSASERQYFADFVFVSLDMRITSFTVPHIGVSDHLPLVVEWK